MVTPDAEKTKMFPQNLFPIGDIAASMQRLEALQEQDSIEKKILEQQKTARAVMRAQEKERAGIGAELHDNVSQLLAASQLYLKCIAGHPEQTDEYVSKAEEYIGNALEEIRKLSHALVGFLPHKMIGIMDSVEQLINDVTRAKNIEINFAHAAVHEEDIKDDLKLVIFRIIQEQLSNILKHANASKIDIELKEQKNDLILTITDNGKGFDITADRDGIGLKNIKNRAELYNGKLDIISSPGNGCTMNIYFKEEWHRGK